MNTHETIKANGVTLTLEAIGRVRERIKAYSDAQIDAALKVGTAAAQATRAINAMTQVYTADQHAWSNYIWQQWTGTSGTLTSSAKYNLSNAYTTSSTTLTSWTQGDLVTCDEIDPHPTRVLIRKGRERIVELPDGAEIHVDADGNYRIRDRDARVTYEAHRNRHFNPYVNAGDQVARFIDFVRREVPGVSREDIPQLPLGLFVNWLVQEAAMRDGDPVPEGVVPVPEDRLLVERVRPRCVLPSCRRFIARAVAAQGFHYCDGEHAVRHAQIIRRAA